MKASRESEHEEPLSQALSQWRVNAPLPPGFQEQVWRRIALAEAGPAKSFWSDLRRVVEGMLPRPGVALAYLAASLALGMTAGAVAAQMKTNQLAAALSTRYVQSVNPYQAEVSQP